jgi:hypothetical protein|tara:strand:- start:678 stop:914 length:237 start_codon:yes stop_codon:yes gene_type:complete
MAQLDINLKNIVIIFSIVGGLIGNVFIVGKLFNQFELLKDDVMILQNNNNILPLRNDMLELGYKIKSLRLELDKEFEE